MVWDIERGQSNRIEPHALADRHLHRQLALRPQHLTSTTATRPRKTVIHMLVDIVSKNGNLLLSVPVRGDGTIDEEELAIVEGIAAWMDVNGEAIFGTRPWKVFGEGPAAGRARADPGPGLQRRQGQAVHRRGHPLHRQGRTVYAIVAWLAGQAARHPLPGPLPRTWMVRLKV